jgi:ATP-dependent Clp protease adapter protein ClpS
MTKEEIEIKQDSLETTIEKYCLILWNDNVNDWTDVVKSLCEVCQVSNEDGYRLMLVAHTMGNSIIKSGSLGEMKKLQSGLNIRNLTTSVEVVIEASKN